MTKSKIKNAIINIMIAAMLLVGNLIIINCDGYIKLAAWGIIFAACMMFLLNADKNYGI